MNWASVRATSVFPTPVGPRNRKEPIGRLGFLRPARERRMARARALIAFSWEMTRLCSSSSMRSSFWVSSSLMEVTGVPITSIKEEETQKLLRIEEELHRRVISQEKAISALARAIRRSRAGLKNPNRPIGSFLFLGPTGVGKTEVARTLAQFMFGSEKSLVRFDMSEFMEKHSVSKLIGSPPGYVGYEEGGQLTERVKRAPYSVVLLDEIEKAHADVFNILLQVFED